jgi:hypothetical protein
LPEGASAPGDGFVRPAVQPAEGYMRIPMQEILSVLVAIVLLLTSFSFLVETAKLRLFFGKTVWMTGTNAMF